jgi:hypothetical protein
VLGRLARGAMFPSDLAASSCANSPGTAPTISSQACGPRKAIESLEKYIENLKGDIDAGRVDLQGNPWVAPPNPFRLADQVNKERLRDGVSLINPGEALSLVLQVVAPSSPTWDPGSAHLHYHGTHLL